MEETQTPKSKKTKATTFTEIEQVGLTLWEQLKQTALPIKKAVFQGTVSSYLGEPETALFSQARGTHKASRVAKMWCTSSVLLIEQHNGFKSIVPLANVKQTILE